MSEQTPVAAPAVIEPLPAKPERRNPFDMDVDSVVNEALTKGAKQAPTTKAREPDSARARAEREVDEILFDGVPEDGGDDDDTEPVAARAQPEPEVEEAEPAEEHGTKDKPYKRADLPDDRFVQVKIDGELQTVSFPELVDGYSGNKAVQKGLESVALAKAAAQREVESAKAEVKRAQDSLREVLGDPEQLFDLMQLERYEPVLQELFKRRWEQLKTWKQAPHLRVEFERQRNEKAFAARAQQQQAAQQAAQQAQQQQLVEEHRMKVLKPGWEDGLKRAGYPESSPELAQYTQGILQARAQAGVQITSEEVAKAVVVASNALGLKPGGKAPAKAEVVRKAPETRANPKGWEAVPRYKKQLDADFLMSRKGRR